MSSQRLRAARQRKLRARLRREKCLHLMIFPVVIWMIVFCYLPIGGMQIAFKDYRFNLGILGSPWVGLENFAKFFQDPYILRALKNTLGLSLTKIAVTMPATLAFAIMLDEIRGPRLKRVVQTVSYFPYFISWPVVLIIVNSWFSPNNGFVNQVLVALGVFREPYYFLGSESGFWGFMASLELWKNLGWGAIIYLSAMTAINPELYEAAEIDGVGRLKKIWHITLPGILPTIVVLFILNVGAMLSGGMFGSNFQQCYLFGNSVNSGASEILDTYVLRQGISMGRFSYATAVGVFTGVVSLVLVGLANAFSKRVTGEGMY